MTSVLFLAPNKSEDFFLRVLIIFDNSGRQKLFMSQNKVESFFKDHLFSRAILLLHANKVEDLFFEINLLQVSSLPFLETGEMTFWEGCALISFALIVYSDGKCRKSA